MSRKSTKLSYHGSPHQKEKKQVQLENIENTTNNNLQQAEQLIPGLPDHISHLILSKISPSILYSISNLWRSFIYSPFYPPFYSLYTILIPNNLTINFSHPTSSSSLQCQCLNTPIYFFSFDPISCQWQPLPTPPPLSLLLRHPPFISRDLPVQSVTVGDKLVVVAGTTQHLAPALAQPVVFDPFDHQGWVYGPPIPMPRRWCATGALDGSLYVASGVGSQFSTDIARSVEKWDLFSKDRKNNNSTIQYNSTDIGQWEKLAPLWDGRFSREATDAVGMHGRLYMVNVKGDAAKQGAVYVTEKNAWEDMKEGMVSGWRGPVATMHEQVMYVVDESKGVIKKYNEEKDGWINIGESERLRGAQQLAARFGKLCVVCKGGSEIVVVDIAVAPPRMWVVQPPQGFNVASVHILPRMSRVL